MDIDFIVQDTFALTRPQWKIATDFTEAARLFSEAVAVNYKAQEPDKTVEPEEEGDDSSSSEAMDEDVIPEVEGAQSSSDEEEVSLVVIAEDTALTVSQAINDDAEQNAQPDSEEEQIFVTRQEEERDPEADAEFDRAFQSMMTESLDSRKFERKTMFDVPLPMRRNPREASFNAEDSAGEGTQTPPNTMAFSLMTKRGNRQQVCTFHNEAVMNRLTLPDSYN